MRSLCFVLSLLFVGILAQVATVEVPVGGESPLCHTCSGGSLFPSYSCSSNWNNTLYIGKFLDPSPAGSVVWQANVAPIGTAGCNGTSNTEYLIMIDGNELSFVSANLTAVTPDCDCGNCAGALPPASNSFSGSMTNYNYSANNDLTFRVLQNTLCLSSLSVSLNYYTTLANNYTVVPTLGPTTGGTTVLVATPAAAFTNTTPIFCYFGLNQVSATYLRDSVVACEAPEVTLPGVVTFRITVGQLPPSFRVEDLDLIDKRPHAGVAALGKTFVYYDEPLITKWGVPQCWCGPEAGNTNITIFATGIISSEFIGCFFGTKFVYGEYSDSDSSVTCQTPPGQGVTSIFLTLNGQQYTDSNFESDFYYLRSLPNNTIAPIGGADDGNTMVNITGNWTTGMMYFCRFFPPTEPGNAETLYTNAVIVSDVLLQCIATVNSTGLQLMWVVEFDHSAQPVIFYSYDPGFLLYDIDVVDDSAVQPTEGNTGTQVIVTGTGFPQQMASTLTCKFNDVVVTGTYVSATQVICPAPAGLSGTVEVLISFNGQQYVAAGDFEYESSKSSNAGKIAAGILVPLAVIGLAAAAFVVIRRRGSYAPI